MSESLEGAIQILTGKRTPPKILDALKGIADPLEIRTKILSDPSLFPLLPELRLAYEIGELRKAKESGTIKLVIGSAGTTFEGWVSTNQNLLNLLTPNKWFAWLNENSVDAMLSEHVWEHLSRAEGTIAAKTCFQFLTPGKRLRVAVPVALMPDPAYRHLCRIGGPDGHKEFYDYRSVRDIFEDAGFNVALLEYWDEHGKFHKEPWNPADGMINRSSQHDPRNRAGKLTYTSLIIDAVKPLAGLR